MSRSETLLLDEALDIRWPMTAVSPSNKLGWGGTGGAVFQVVAPDATRYCAYRVFFTASARHRRRRRRRRDQAALHLETR